MARGSGKNKAKTNDEMIWKGLTASSVANREGRIASDDPWGQFLQTCEISEQKWELPSYDHSVDIPAVVRALEEKGFVVCIGFPNDLDDLNVMKNDFYHLFFHCATKENDTLFKQMQMNLIQFMFESSNSTEEKRNIFEWSFKGPACWYVHHPKSDTWIMGYEQEGMSSVKIAETVASNLVFDRSGRCKVVIV